MKYKKRKYRKINKILLPLFLLCVLLLFFLKSHFIEEDAPVLPSTQIKVTEGADNIKETEEVYEKDLKATVFIPYWNTNDINSVYLPSSVAYAKLENVIYFGIAPDENGINRDDKGYINISSIGSVQNILLAIRMMDEDINSKIFNDITLKNNVINNSITLALDHNFTGIVLDLEHSVLSTEKNINDITNFVQDFSEKAKNNNLFFGMTIYGDVFYRQRPYDIQKLDMLVDRFYIMAYDFHKSYGEPGPNFPLNKGSKYSYDMNIMIDQFLEKTSADKLSVIFGMYGYNWKVDEKNRPITRATAETLNQARKIYFDDCLLSRCSAKRDSDAGEMFIEYFDDENRRHIVWIEDETSVQKKTDLLRKKGVEHIGFWAWGYY